LARIHAETSEEEIKGENAGEGERVLRKEKADTPGATLQGQRNDCVTWGAKPSRSERH